MSKQSDCYELNIKEAHVRPLLVLKKHLFLKTNWKITGLSKILQKVVADRLRTKKNNYLSNPLQSTSMKHLSTVSALLKVCSDIIVSMDKGEVTAPAVHDLTIISHTS